MCTEQAQTAGYNQTHLYFCLFYPLTIYAGDRDVPLPLGYHSAGPHDFQPVLNNRPTVMSGNKPTFTWQSKLFPPTLAGRRSALSLFQDLLFLSLAVILSKVGIQERYAGRRKARRFWLKWSCQKDCLMMFQSLFSQMQFCGFLRVPSSCSSTDMDNSFSSWLSGYHLKDLLLEPHCPSRRFIWAGVKQLQAAPLLH